MINTRKAKLGYLTLFFPMFPFDPPENIRKPLVFCFFKGDQKGALGRKGLKSKSPYLARMWQNMDQKNSEYGHFSHSVF